jgi:hypothetical protein
MYLFQYDLFVVVVPSTLTSLLPVVQDRLPAVVVSAWLSGKL